MRWVAIFFIAICVSPVKAGGIDSLETFIRKVQTGKAEFTQIVTLPAREGQTLRPKTSSGTFSFHRPNKFKFIYKKPFEQSIVADGQTLWFFDADLNQVTARKQAQVLGNTPAALIASAADVRTLEADFVLTEAPLQDGLEWVVALPKARDSSLQSVRAGFRGTDLVRMEMLDSFGQRSVLTFSGFQSNVPVDIGSFQFRPPAGADVIRQ